MNEYQLAKKTCDVTVGESVKIIREVELELSHFNCSSCDPI